MISDEQRSGLWRAKLHSLVRDHFGRTDGIDHEVPWGAVVDHDGAWTALIESAPERTFGQALVLAARNQATSLDLLIQGEPDAIGAVARRAQLFDPSPSVWKIDGTDVAPAAAVTRVVLDAQPIAPHVAELLVVDDIDVVIEHGETMIECRGLEVGRVNGMGEDQRLMVGVGAYDQGAFEVMNPHLTPIESLAEVVSQVLLSRTTGARPHPLNRLCRERWVRHELLNDPSALGLMTLTLVEPMTQRDGLKDVMAASAIGETASGERVLVSCTVGIDLDAVPGAVDLAAEHDASRIVIVVPDRDRHPQVEAIARRSKVPVEFVTSPEPWLDT